MEPPYLEIITPNGRKQLRLTGEAVTIGRAPQNSIIVDDNMASRQHCSIDPVGAGGYVVRDLQSRNGTVVNNQKIEAEGGVPLNPGDVILIGSTKFRYIAAKKTAVPPELPHEAAAETLQAEEETPVELLEDDDSALPVPEPVQDKRTATTLADLKAAGAGRKAPARGRGGAASKASGGAVSEAEMALRQLAGSQREDIIGLVNARGETVHAAATDEEEPDSNVTSEGIRILKLLLLTAMQTRASDLHFEPKSTDHSVRMRVDGMMIDVVKLEAPTALKLHGAIKVLADIDIAQRTIVQEGHFSANAPGRRVDYRVSFTPSSYGQKLVVRVLDLVSAPQVLDQLNMPAWILQEIRKTSRQSAGMVLVCGPTGSGKTTTLYSVLRDIDVHQRNVITIEDPVEYSIEGVTQIPIDEGKGNTFHSMLRSVLRQDPDVLLVGEIRDPDTASTAMQAAMTGHLVLSTVHAKDTIGTVFRLLDLGVEPFMMASSLNLVLAQRLIRLLCPHCKASKKPTPTETKMISRPGAEVARIYYGVGCPKCYGTGFYGRRALFELLTMSDQLRDIVLKKPSMQDIKEVLKRSVFIGLQDAGYALVNEGVSSMDEVERAVGGV